MVLCDVNVLVYAYREDAERHAEYRRWLEDLINQPTDFGISELVLSGFFRIVTHPGIFDPPSPWKDALRFIEAVRNRPNAVPIHPGGRHFGIFLDLCLAVEARGNLIPDAYLAALAMESGCEWVSADRVFSRFPKLKWRHPLAKA